MTAHGTRYKVDGEQLTVAQIATRIGISAPAAHGRLKRARDRSSRLTWASLGVGAPPSRQQRMLHFIAGLGRPATLDEVIAAVAVHEPEADRSQLANAVAAQLSQLTKAGKLTRVGERCRFTYQPTATTLLDGRGRAGRWKNAKPKPVKVPKPPKPARPKSAPVAKPAKPKRTAKTTSPVTQRPVAQVIRAADLPPSPAKRPGEFQIVDKPAPVANANLKRPREGALDSAQIAADIAAFEARGGRIERFQPGESSQSSQSIRERNDAYLAARGQGLAKQRAVARIATRAQATNDDTLDAADEADVA